MRLHTGLGANLTVLRHTTLRHQLFGVTGKFKLSTNMVPLCNHSAKDVTIAMMPACNAHNVEGDWQEPPEYRVRAWFDTLVKRTIIEEKDLIHETTDEELGHISSRAKETQMAEVAGGSGFVAADLDEEVEDELVEESPEEPVR